MVRAYYPQRSNRSILVNSSYPPQGLVPGGVPVFGLLLDDFPGAAAAYSLRELNSAYSGPAIRVRRESDDAELDIGFLNGSLDVAALVAFVGSSDGRITIHYDQSGNGIDLDAQLVDFEMPKIIIAGVLQQSNALESIDYDGINDVLQSTLLLNSPASQLFVFCLWQKTILSNSPVNFNLDAPANSSTRRCTGLAPFDSPSSIFWDPGSLTTDRLATATGFNDLLQHQYTLTKIAGTDNQTIRRDGTQLAQRTQGSTSTILSEIAIGSFGITGIFNAAMQFQELVLYVTNVQSSISGIENNILNFWTVEFLLVTNGGDELVTETGDNLVFN